MNKSVARRILGIIGVVGYILLTGGFFAIMFFGDKVNLPEGQLGTQIVGMFGMIVGTWTAFFTAIYMFSFGTSQGSKDANDVVKKVVEDGNEVVKKMVEKIGAKAL